MANGDEPRLDSILETVLYCRDGNCDDMNRFYDEVLGLRSRSLGTGAYRVGPAVLLIFNAKYSSVQQSPPPHGTSGRAHTCFVTSPGDYEYWKERIRTAGAKIIEEIEWTAPFGGRSFYFHDPAGNVLEIANQDLWPEGKDQA